MKNVLFILFIILLLTGLELCGGAFWLSPTAFHSADGWDPVFLLRLQRIMTAVVVGGSLSLSGMILQAVLRNPLAEPFTLGLSGGASVGAALAFLFGWYATSFFSVPLGAFTGAIAVFFIVLWISRGGRNGTETLLLSGVISGTIASSLLMYLLSISTHDELAGITWWTLGDLQSADPRLLLPGFIIMAMATCFLRVSADKLDAISLGEDIAFHLGGNPRRLTLCLVAVASLLAATTVAMAGIISFCGLIIPHIIRRCYGCLHRRIVLPTVCWGAAFLLLCDFISRCLSAQREIPIGVMTAVIGGPVFLWILNHHHLHA